MTSDSITFSVILKINFFGLGGFWIVGKLLDDAC